MGQILTCPRALLTIYSGVMKQKPRKPRKPFYAATRDGKAGVTLYMERAIHKDLKYLALDLNLTLEGLMRQASLGRAQAARPSHRRARTRRPTGWMIRRRAPGRRHLKELRDNIEKMPSQCVRTSSAVSKL